MCIKRKPKESSHYCLYIKIVHNIAKNRKSTLLCIKEKIYTIIVYIK